MLRVLNQILVLLSVDGETRLMAEISRIIRLKERRVVSSLKLLSSIGFVRFDGKGAIIDLALKQLVLENEDNEGD